MKSESFVFKTTNCRCEWQVVEGDMHYGEFFAKTITVFPSEAAAMRCLETIAFKRQDGEWIPHQLYDRAIIQYKEVPAENPSEKPLKNPSSETLLAVFDDPEKMVDIARANVVEMLTDSTGAMKIFVDGVMIFRAEHVNKVLTTNKN